MSRSFISRSLPFTFACIGLFDSTGFSQSNSAQYRPTGGWKSSPTAADSANVLHRNSSNATSPVYRASYQAEGGIGLPPFPGANTGGNLPVAQEQPRLVLPQNLPSMPNALSGASAPPTFPPTQQLPSYGGQNLQSQNGPVVPNDAADQATYNRQAQTVGAGNELRAVAQTAAPQGNQLRPTSPTAQTGFGTNMQTQQIATGLPFVTPPPRTGNFPTSPYNGARFQTVSFQTANQPVVNTANVASTQPVLPQNLTPNIYPTAYQQCAPGAAGVIPTYPPPGAVPGTYVPPTLTPNLTPTTYSPNNSGYSPLFSLGQENYNVTIGRGIIGQPTVYVPGQPVRNFMRYLSP